MSNKPFDIARLAFNLIDYKLWNTADSMIMELGAKGFCDLAQFLHQELQNKYIENVG
jgi:hypothetical protein